MRSYGDKPAAYLRLVPNGLLPAVSIDDRIFTGTNHPSMWPASNSPEFERAKGLMRLERDLFSRWCNLVFRPSMGDSSKKFFEECFDEVNKQLAVTEGPWFLSSLSIVDLQYVTHIERMYASAAYWSGMQLRGDRWANIERWIRAFEQRNSYLATKSDYYTHCMDIPPQYGPGFPLPGSEVQGRKIDGSDGTSWNLPLPAFNPSTDVEPVYPDNDPGVEESKQEAAYKLLSNYENIIKFALRGAGQPGKKQFQAPLADPYATPALEYYDDFSTLIKLLVQILLDDYQKLKSLPIANNDSSTKKSLKVSLAYLRDRIGVPRDLSYPAARQLRAHINFVIDLLK